MTKRTFLRNIITLFAGIAAAAACVVLLSRSAAAEAPAAAPDAVAAVEIHYRSVTDLTAAITQKNFLASIGKTQIFSGTLSIKKPGRLRLEFSNGQLIVLDGASVWFYSRKSEQAIKRAFRDFEQVNIPVAFLLGAAHLRDDFNVVVRSEAALRNTFDLMPKKKDAAMKQVEMVCDDEGRISALIIHDRSGNTSSISFSDVRENTGLDDSLFRFKAPKGTEIIEQ